MTVFLAEGRDLIWGYGVEGVGGARHAYSDSLVCHERWTNEALMRAEEKVGNRLSAAFYEGLLRDVLQKPTLDLCHVLVGVDGRGFDYQFFGYLEGDR
jgi:hypothetical protein